MMLHYFLGDDTIEIRDIIRPNAGRDAIPVFVRRCKLPRQGHRLHQPGVETDRTVLNVCSSRHLLDSLKTGAFHEVRYFNLTHISVINIILGLLHRRRSPNWQCYQRLGTVRNFNRLECV